MNEQVPERDLEALEAHLDGALPSEASLALCRRLSAEPDLAAALHELRAQRTVRQAVWASLEPDDAGAGATVSAAFLTAVRQERLHQAVRRARRLTAAAAVVAIAFAGGWAARARLAAPHASRDVHPQAGHRFVTSGGGVGEAFYPVALTDENGNITAVQYFETPEAARRFAEDVGRWQSKPRQPQAVPIVPASGEF